MMLIKNYLSKSAVHGIGVFADQEVEKGQKVYQWSPIYDVELTQDQFSQADPKEKEVIQHYGYLSKFTGKWHMTSDNLRFCNHSRSPNIGMRRSDYIALRDIKQGEELFCDYSEFENLRSDVK